MRAKLFSTEFSQALHSAGKMAGGCIIKDGLSQELSFSEMAVEFQEQKEGEPQWANTFSICVHQVCKCFICQ